jgi:histidinol-phosphate aminotransferase
VKVTGSKMDQISEHLWLGNSGDPHMMMGAGVTYLIDLRAECGPPRFPVPVDHIRIEDLVDGQVELILSAGQRVADLVEQGHVVGIYCQSGVSRTPAVAICYLMLKGASLEDATAIVREARPAAMPALGLYRALEAIEAGLAADEPGYAPG